MVTEIVVAQIHLFRSYLISKEEKNCNLHQRTRMHSSLLAHENLVHGKHNNKKIRTN